MNTTTDSSIPSTSTSSEHTEECQPPKKKRKGLVAILTKIFSNNSEGHSHSPTHPREKVEAELTRYLDLPVVLSLYVVRDPLLNKQFQLSIHSCIS